MLYRRFVTLFSVFLAIVWSLAYLEPGWAQDIPSATPAQITIPSAVPPVTEVPNITPTPTFTPTPIGAVMLEAKNEANVRAAPSLDSDRLGTIRAGETFPVLGHYFRWFQFRYDPSPSGTGWVYDELVNVIGDVAEIPEINANVLPTIDTSSLNITQTWEAITQTPGGLLTATAEARFIQPPSNPQIEVTQEAFSGLDSNALEVLPTFTYPPNIIAQAPNNTDPNILSSPTETTSSLADVVSNGIAPIVPIMALVGFGLLGLTISSRRR